MRNGGSGPSILVDLTIPFLFNVIYTLLIEIYLINVMFSCELGNLTVRDNIVGA